MKLNQKDLLLHAQLKGLFLPESMSPKEIIEYIRKHEDGEKIDVAAMHHPFWEMSDIQMTWVEDHFDTISAQHPGFPDCIRCEAAMRVKCFLENLKTMIRGGYLNQDNPWLLKR